MKFYTIINENLLIADKKETLEKYYENIKRLPDDYEAEKFIIQNEELTLNPDYEIEQAKKERQRIDNLSLTAADVERAIYKAKGIDFEDILELVKDNSEIDFKALRIELKANNFYRGNPYINQIGAILGFSKKQLDEFFEKNDYTKLLPIEDENEELPEVVAENATSDDKLPM